ncbi:uncharacterized protein LOC131306766 [Rhododendron vialii]|uniref:uncharacterized protein LOC131306766 n=1 Tax=Rhododendron vialii TaxID=182163 RepID=UPI00265E9029|nr:uncharacterized protein LOC131306766 [Rhododendron vialii]
MPDFSKFDGTGDPKTHLLGYHVAMKLFGVEDDVMVQMLPQTLSGPAFQWFLSFDVSKRRTWEDIGAAFVLQYNYNSQLEMTTRELESTNMEAKKSFVDFIKRWMDALQSEILHKGEPSSKKAKLRLCSRNSSALFGNNNYSNTTTSGSDAPAFNSNYTANINQVQNAQNSRHRTQRRNFFAFEASLSAVMEKLFQSEHFKPLTPTSLPKVLPANYNASHFCAFHQMHGHLTDSCLCL